VPEKISLFAQATGVKGDQDEKTQIIRFIVSQILHQQTMRKGILVSLALICILAVMMAGCTDAPPAPVPTPTPQIIYVTVLVTPTPAPAMATNTPDQRHGTLMVMAPSFTGKATLNLDGNDSGTLTQSTPFTVQLSPGNHKLITCVGSVCDLEDFQINATKVTTLDMSKRLSDFAANAEPSVKVIDTTPASNQILVSVQFVNPTKDDLTMTAVVVCPYQYGGGKLGSGTSSGSGIARVDVAAGGRAVTIVTIGLSNEIGTVYVGATPTISNFRFSKTVIN
jgi:hypothetical protein